MTTINRQTEREGTLAAHLLEDGRELAVYPMLFGKARLCIGAAGASTYDDAWCYESVTRAIEVTMTWDGEGDAPVGWHRQISTGRRREEGDPNREYVRR